MEDIGEREANGQSSPGDVEMAASIRKKYNDARGGIPADAYNYHSTLYSGDGCNIL